MPEGPEVTLMVDKLRGRFVNTTLKKVIFVSGRYVRHGPPKRYKSFINSLPSKIQNIENKGKFVWITLDDNWTIWLTLGMTGHLQLRPTKYERIKFETVKGKEESVFYLNDMRNFGTINFCPDPSVLIDKLNKLGPFPLVDKITKKQFINIVRGKRKQTDKIGDVLMDQRMISGIGNYIR